MPNDVIVLQKEDTPTLRGGPRRGEPKLKSLKDVGVEMRRMYRACFYRREVSPEDYAKAVFGLRVLGEVIEAVDFEERLLQLEKRS